jgi:hypothetical protein
VAVFLHPLTALVLCDFGFTSLFKGTHVKSWLDDWGVEKATGKTN